jgi:predicted TIM-barrel fold metal-dependent hydrolase
MIDFHTHPVMIKELVEKDSSLAAAVRDVWGLLFPPQPLEIFIRELDEAGVDKAVLLALDCSSAHGCQIPGNEAVADLVSRNDRFIGFASVDPNRKDAEASLQRAIRQLGLKGLKLDPALQRFDPRDREKAFPLYGLCGELGIPVLMHMGMSWAPRGRADMAQPLFMEEVLQSFPNVNFVIPHFGWPWVDETLMLALKYANAFLDTSLVVARTPREALQKVIGERIGIAVLEGSLPGQVLFGSNYPRQDIRRAVRGVQALGFSPVFMDALCSGNAARLLKLEGNS